MQTSTNSAVNSTPAVKKLVLAHVKENIHVDVTGLSHVAAAQKVKEETVDLTVSPSSIGRILQFNQSYGGWQAIVVDMSGATNVTPVSKHDAKKFGLDDDFKPSQAAVKAHVAAVVEAVPVAVAAAAAEVAEVVTEVPTTLDDPSNEGVVWAERRNVRSEPLPIRKSSKTYAIALYLKGKRANIEELTAHLYKIGFDNLTESKMKSALHDLVSIGYRVGRIGTEDERKAGTEQYVIRNWDLSPVDIRVQATKKDAV